MIYNIIAAIVFLSFSGCGSGETSTKEEIVEVRSNEFIKERRYYNPNKNLIGIVHFTKGKSRQITPIDSIRYDITLTGELSKVRYFNYENGKYAADVNSPMHSFYETIFNSVTGCNDLKGVANAYLLLEAANDICTIGGSVLSNGQEASELRKVQIDSTSEGLNKTIAYDSLNSVFVGLTEEVQSYFYQQALKGLKVTIKDNFLSKEEYSFSDGSLTREYVYKKGQVTSVIITVKNNESNLTERIMKEYFYR